MTPHTPPILNKSESNESTAKRTSIVSVDPSQELELEVRPDNPSKLSKTPLSGKCGEHTIPNTTIVLRKASSAVCALAELVSRNTDEPLNGLRGEGPKRTSATITRSCIGIPRLASPLEPVRESVRYRSLRLDVNGVLRNLLPVQQRRVLGQVPSGPLLPQRPQ